MNNRLFDTVTVFIAVILLVSTVSLSRASIPNAINIAHSFGSKSVKIAAEQFLAGNSASKPPAEQSAENAVFVSNTLTDLSSTPSDIAKLIAAAEKKAKNEKIIGKITEKKYSAGKTEAIIDNIAIRNTTTTQQNINLLKYYNEDAEIKIKEKSEPTVLIFHTHTTECYEMLDRNEYAEDYLTRTAQADRNMVRVGKEIKAELEKAGYAVLHDTTIHDEKYTGAYAHSRESVEKYLKENPTIQVVLDIHRDAIELDSGERIKPTAEIMGKKAAQLMIITGCEEGKIKQFKTWEKNLTFAMKLQSVCEKNFSGLMRPIFFCQRKYNMDLCPNNLLIEVGSDSNTLDEAAYSGRLLGYSLAKLLDNYTEKDEK